MSSFPSSDDTPLEQSANAVRKHRQCLRCRARFYSEWAGERICSHCKSTVAWRTGVPPHSRSDNRSR
jgi:hypothetical protein